MAIDHFMKNALATCGFPEYYAYILKDAGVNVIQQLLAKHISFPTQATPIDHGGVREVLQTLHAIPIREADIAAGWAPWLLDAEGETTQFTKFLTLVQECRLMRAAASAAYAKAATVEADDELPQPKTAAPAPATTGSAKDPDAESLKQFQIVAGLYSEFEEYTNGQVPSDQRIGFSIIYKENENFKSGHAVHNIPLEAYGLQQDYVPTKKTMDMFGETLVKTTSASPDCPIDGKEAALEQLRRQAEARAVAGAFNPADLAKETWRVQCIHKDPKSKVKHIKGGVVVESEFFATREGQMLKYQVIKQIADQNGLGAAGIIALSKNVDKAFKEAILRGHTADAAVRKAVIEDHHNVAAHIGVDAEARSKSSGALAAAAADPGTSAKALGKRPAADRTTDEQAAAKDRHIANQQAQIENLKRGRGKGAGGGKGGGRGNPSWVPPGFNYAPPPQYQQYQQWQPQFGKGMGKGGWPMQPPMTPPQVRPRFADHVCADFNLRACASPCPNGRQHVCGNCGGAHPWKACPTKQ
jgi:hypothetical protein